MSNPLAYSRKAEQYARYRWDYAPAAIQTIYDLAQIDEHSRIADIGSGTGILTKHFVTRAGFVAAIEPDAMMRAWAELTLAGNASFHSIHANAEHIPLAQSSINVIIVGQAIHWFNPNLARAEFQRILKPSGWLAMLWNQPADQQHSHALAEICIAENGWSAPDADNRPAPVEHSVYYGHEDYQHLVLKVRQEQNWVQFFGALCSDSHAPDNDHLAFIRFKTAAQRVFEEYSTAGQLVSTYTTTLNIGQISEVRRTEDVTRI